MKVLSLLLLVGFVGSAPLAFAKKPPAPSSQIQAENSDATITKLLKKPLTMKGALRIALLNNRMLQSTFEDIGLSQADLIDARSLANPEFDIALKFPDRSPGGAMTEWGLVQNFLDLLVIPLRTAVARDQLDATKARVADAVVQIVSEVKIAFLQVQADALILEKLATIRDAQRVSLEFSQKLHHAGNITDLALLREQVSYSDSTLAIAQATAVNRVHHEALNRLLSLWGQQTDWKITAPLPDISDSLPSVAHLESLAVANRADLASSRLELQAALRSAGLEKRFRFIGGLGFGVVGEHDPDGANLRGPSFNFSLPIFNQGQGKTARSQALLRKSQRQFEGLAIDIRSNVRELRDQLISQADIARYYRDQAIPNREKILKATLLNYNAMITGAFELFLARRDIAEAERNHIEATRDYWITHAKLERVLGGEPSPSNNASK